jgi:hypothetical protein
MWVEISKEQGSPSERPAVGRRLWGRATKPEEQRVKRVKKGGKPDAFPSSMETRWVERTHLEETRRGATREGHVDVRGDLVTCGGRFGQRQIKRGTSSISTISDVYDRA